jgi:putative peptidoglycan lipid II flippase
VLAPAFYALDDARTPAVASLLSIATNLLLNWVLVHLLGFGHVGLALATSAVALGNFSFLYLGLRRRLGAFDAQLGGALVRVALVTLVMAAVVRAADVALAPGLAGGWRGHALRLGLLVPLGAAVFWGGGRLAGIPVPRLSRRS